LIPLLGNEIEVVLHFVQRLRIELELAFATGAEAMNDSGTFEDAKMLGNGLAGEFRATRELRDRMWLTAAQPGYDPKACFVAERGKNQSGRTARCHPAAKAFG